MARAIKRLFCQFSVIVLPSVHLKVFDAVAQGVDVGCDLSQRVAILVRADDDALARHGNDRVDLETSDGAAQKAFLIEEQAVAFRTDGIGFERIETDQPDDIAAVVDVDELNGLFFGVDQYGFHGGYLVHHVFNSSPRPKGAGEPVISRDQSDPDS